MSDKVLTIGSRSSDLALWQANYVKNMIEKNFPEINVQIKYVKTKGDKIQDTALHQIGSKGLFTKEIENVLLKKNIDIAVHSLKDMETTLPQGLKLAAVSERHAVEDVLIAREKGTTIDDLPRDAKAASGSLRRRAQLLYLRTDIQLQELRGNVNTRIEKFLNSDWDAILIARAGVERLGLEDNISSIIPTEQILPAVGQGALGIEISEDNALADQTLSKLNHLQTWNEITAERAFLKGLGGGCQTPIAAYAIMENQNIKLDGLVCSLDGKQRFRKTIVGEDPEELGRSLANTLMEQGAGEIIRKLEE